jgi:hypothetical protein
VVARKGPEAMTFQEILYAGRRQTARCLVAFEPFSLT